MSDKFLSKKKRNIKQEDSKVFSIPEIMEQKLLHSIPGLIFFEIQVICEDEKKNADLKSAV